MASVPGAARRMSLAWPLELDRERVRVGLELRAQRAGIEAEALQVVMMLPMAAIRAVAEPPAHALCRLTACGVPAVPEEAIRHRLRLRDDLPVMQVQNGIGAGRHAHHPRRAVEPGSA